VLVAGFGGMLALMAVAGADSLLVLKRVREQNDRITQDYLRRDRALNSIRSALYLSGTYVRDYLLDRDSTAAEAHRDRLKKLRGETDPAIHAYAASLRPEEAAPFSDLTQELATYWRVLDPVFQWNAPQRHERGYAFLTGQVFPHRAKLLEISDLIGAVNERQLSVGNRSSTELLENFRRRLALMLGVTLGIGLLLAVASVLYILRLEKDAFLRYREIVEAREALESLSARLVEAQEQERRSLSRELHDGVGQAMSALLVDIGNADAAAPASSPELKRRLDSMKKLAEESLRVVRNMSLLLRPSMLDDFGLVPALHWQAREVGRRTAMRVEVSADEAAGELPDGHKTCVYRLAQEALENCSRHSGARLVKILVRQEPHRLLVVVQDDGIGFDAARVRGLGLIGMEERVRHLGGTFQVESEPGRGTLLKVELPLAGAGAGILQPAS
ncbi:MAG: MCP four helix bundle domain-containing protein, partial [Candidatus Solibacter usitatus]|nr:MCP four helix bundle domain-containing protein [Candidatus Solibacter usitatus]